MRPTRGDKTGEGSATRKTASKDDASEGRSARTVRRVNPESSDEKGEAMQIFCGSAHCALGEAIAKMAGQVLGRVEVSQFPDGETKIRIIDNVRGKNIFIVQPTVPPVNERLMELLVLADALRRASARSITAVIPYFGYARQDRKHEGRVPITAKLVANLITAAGIGRVVTVDLHAPQIQGFFDIPVDHLIAAPTLVHYLRSLDLEKPTFMAPDIGSVKLADAFAKRMGGELAIVHKRRINDLDTEAGHVIGEVADRDIIVADDMITSGSSMAQAVKAARQRGARSVRAVATHGLFVGPAWDRLLDSGVTEVVVTDSVPLRETPPEGFPLNVVSMAPLLGEAIVQIHKNQSVSRLFE